MRLIDADALIKQMTYAMPFDSFDKAEWERFVSLGTLTRLVDTQPTIKPSVYVTTELDGGYILSQARLIYPNGETCVSEIKRTPIPLSEDAVSVVHGEWIHIEGDDPWEWTCSACMKNSEIHGEHPNYCPNCGAKMCNSCTDCQEFDCYGCKYKKGAE